MEAGREAAFMSRDLATIRTDLKLTLDLAEAALTILISRRLSPCSRARIYQPDHRLDKFAKATQPEAARSTAPPHPSLRYLPAASFLFSARK